MFKVNAKLTRRMAIFASGAGSNALNIINFFGANTEVEVAFVLSNKPDAGVVSLAQDAGVEVIHYCNAEVKEAQKLIDLCKQQAIDFIVLAGFLRKLPEQFVTAYSRKIINIHPSLLPKYGGKGMYGDRVHAQVLTSKESESGVSIHFVDSNFDTGDLIAQFHCKIEARETVQTLRAKIHKLEHAYYPWVIKNTFLI